MRSSAWGAIIVTVGLLSWFGSAPATEPAAATPAKIDFAQDIRPILNKNCTACHGGVKRIAGVSFIVRERALAKTDDDVFPIVPGDPDHSEMIRRVSSKDPDERMPPPEHGPALSGKEVALLKEWIRQGAPWKEHWAYVAPLPQTPPKVTDPDWCRTALDRFVLAKLDAAGLKPSPSADRLQWLRRVSFDLIGLPPTPAESEAFLADRSPDAFEKVVDRLLASQAFGERWASMWLDLARYADTQGYERDLGRTVWPYRDWVIRAFNADMPYDQFAIRQLAGDLFPKATLDDQLATVFHRNTQTNVEGGTDDEEFRVAAVLDRVNTTWEVFQGVTFRCTQCHSHPYEPIDHEDYYRFMAFFNTTRDWDLPDDLPVLRAPLATASYERAGELDRRLATLEVQERAEVEKTRAAAASAWQPLKPVRVASTKQTTLVIEKQGDQFDVVATGTVSHDSQFTIELPVPGSDKITALRIQAFPKDLKAAALTPEFGFVISQLRAQLTSPGGAAGPVVRDIVFHHVLGDETHPFLDPELSLNRDRAGWGPMPRIDRQREVVFVAAESVAVPPGSTLKLILDFNFAPGDQAPEVMNRGRFAITPSERWSQLVQGDAFKLRRREMSTVRQERSRLGGVDVPVMVEQDTPLKRNSAIFQRGNWLDKGEVVTPGLPQVLPALHKDAPLNRLGMAVGITSSQNPLAARVAVNRFWEQIFGVGIVETIEDFGVSGARPSNPELLDFLAVQFQTEMKWSIKKLLREFVLSATYQQDSKVSPELLEKDPRNRLLAGGPRLRLTAEMVRDQALAVSGLLSTKMYGPPVMPPQPDGVWRSVYNNARWQTAEGEDRYRRAVYTFWKRTAGYPTAIIFDVPSREVCTSRRITTNTPLQALITLNDPVYFECAQSLARRMYDAEHNPLSQIAFGWEHATGRKPADDDVQTLSGLYERTLKRYVAATPAPPGTAEQASLSVIGNAPLNLDVVLTK